MAIQEMKAICIEHTQQIAGHEMSIKSILDRLDRAEDTVEAIHKMSANMENLTAEVKELGQTVAQGLKEQGVRIGTLEKVNVGIVNTIAKIDTICERVKNIESAPGKKWNNAVWLVLSVLITAAIMYFVNRYALPS